MEECQIKRLATSRLSDICIESLTMQVKGGESFFEELPISILYSQLQEKDTCPEIIALR